MAAFMDDSSLETWMVYAHPGPVLRPAQSTGTCCLEVRHRAASCHPRNRSSNKHLPAISSRARPAKAYCDESFPKGGGAEAC